MSDTDPVIVRFKADVDRYKADITSAQRLTDDKLDAIERKGLAVGQGLKRGFSLAKAAAISFAASFAVSEITSAISKGLEYASSLGEVSQQLGVTTGDLQLFRFAASQVGIEQGEMDQGLQKLTKSIGDAAQGSKPAIEAFSKLGVNIRDAKGEIRTAGDLLPDLADGFQRLGSDAERTAVAQDLFSRSGFKLLTLFANGSKGVNDLAAAYRRLGIELTPEQIRNADDAADSLGAVKQVLEARIAGVVADNAKEIVELANALANLADKAIKAGSAWLEFRRKQNTASEQYARADAYLAGRRDLTPAARAKASAGARRIIDDRIGIKTSTTSYLGGLFKLRSIEDKPKAKFGDALLNLGGSFPAAVSGAPGRGGADRLSALSGAGGGLAALLAVNPTVAIAAVNGLSAELQRLDAEVAEASAELSGDLREQAAARKLAITAQLAADLDQVRTNDSIKGDQKGEHESRLRLVASLKSQEVDRRLSEDLERKTAEAQEKALRQRLDALASQNDTLAAEAEAEPNRKKRNEIERQILANSQEEERARLEAAIAAGEVADAEGERAKLKRKQVADQRNLDREGLSPAQSYLADLNAEAANLNDAFETIAVDGLQRFNDKLAESVKSALGLHGVFGDIIGDIIELVIRQQLIRPIADLIGNAGGGGGGGFLGGFLKLVGIGGGTVGTSTAGHSLGGGLGGGRSWYPLAGRASGGYVAPGQTYRINEGSSPGNVEAFMSRDGGRIIPLGQMNALRSGGQQAGGEIMVRVTLTDDLNATIDNRAAGVAVEVVRSSAGAIIDAGAREALSRAGRPRL